MTIMQHLINHGAAGGKFSSIEAYMQAQLNGTYTELSPFCRMLHHYGVPKVQQKTSLHLDLSPIMEGGLVVGVMQLSQSL